MNPFEQVKEFHKVFGVYSQEESKYPTAEIQLLRRKLLMEEVNEYLDSEYVGDFYNVAKELADIIYIALGTAVSYGIPMDKVFDAVHQSNMSKLDDYGRPVVREDGKVVKGPNYKAPDIKKIIDDHSRKDSLAISGGS